MTYAGASTKKKWSSFLFSNFGSDAFKKLPCPVVGTCVVRAVVTVGQLVGCSHAVIESRYQTSMVVMEAFGRVQARRSNSSLTTLEVQ